MSRRRKKPAVKSSATAGNNKPQTDTAKISTPAITPGDETTSSVARPNADRRIGFVFVMTNATQPGLVKVGKTERHPSERVKDEDLTTSAIPTPFVVEYYALVDDMDDVELKAHARLAKQSVGKDFFQADPSSAALAIEQVSQHIRFRETNFTQAKETDAFEAAISKLQSSTVDSSITTPAAEALHDAANLTQRFDPDRDSLHTSSEAIHPVRPVKSRVSRSLSSSPTAAAVIDAGSEDDVSGGLDRQQATLDASREQPSVPVQRSVNESLAEAILESEGHRTDREPANRDELYEKLQPVEDDVLGTIDNTNSTLGRSESHQEASEETTLDSSAVQQRVGRFNTAGRNDETRQSVRSNTFFRSTNRDVATQAPSDKVEREVLSREPRKVRDDSRRAREDTTHQTHQTPHTPNAAESVRVAAHQLREIQTEHRASSPSQQAPIGASTPIQPAQTEPTPIEPTLSSTVNTQRSQTEPQAERIAPGLSVHPQARGTHQAAPRLGQPNLSLEMDPRDLGRAGVAGNVQSLTNGQQIDTAEVNTQDIESWVLRRDAIQLLTRIRRFSWLWACIGLIVGAVAGFAVFMFLDQAQFDELLPWDQFQLDALSRVIVWTTAWALLFALVAWLLARFYFRDRLSAAIHVLRSGRAR